VMARCVVGVWRFRWSRPADVVVVVGRGGKLLVHDGLRAAGAYRFPDAPCLSTFLDTCCGTLYSPLRVQRWVRCPDGRYRNPLRSSIEI
jgi:hypothetical protein